jgi:pyrroloquinoline quinone biosynthesis protein B
MWIQLLGSGASAGFPVWNDGSEAARRARDNDPAVPIRQGAALAISADGERYSILEAPLHLAMTVARNPRFAPAPGTRAVPIDSLLLTSAELDASAGLLGFASALSLRIVSPTGLRDCLLEQNACFRSLEPVWLGSPWDRTIPLDRDGILEARFFPLPGPPPDHLRELAPRAGRARSGVRITDQRTGTRLVWAPRITRLDAACLEELRAADLRFVDGTCYAAEELRSIRPGLRDPGQAGHTPIDGHDGSLAWLAGMRGQSFYVHLAGSNPACDQASAESARIRAARVEVAVDGQELSI